MWDFFNEHTLDDILMCRPGSVIRINPEGIQQMSTLQDKQGHMINLDAQRHRNNALGQALGQSLGQSLGQALGQSLGQTHTQLHNKTLFEESLIDYKNRMYSVPKNFHDELQHEVNIWLEGVFDEIKE